MDPSHPVPSALAVPWEWGSGMEPPLPYSNATCHPLLPWPAFPWLRGARLTGKCTALWIMVWLTAAAGDKMFSALSHAWWQSWKLYPCRLVLHQGKTGVFLTSQWWCCSCLWSSPKRRRARWPSISLLSLWKMDHVKRTRASAFFQEQTWYYLAGKCSLLGGLYLLDIFEPCARVFLQWILESRT